MKTISTISAAIMLAVCPVTPARADGVTSADVLRDSLPEHWELDRQYFQTTPTDDRWWDTFNDPVLTGLLRRAVGNNFDVVAARSRIEAARQVCTAARSGYYPTVGGAAGWNHDRTVMTGTSGRPTGEVTGYFTLGLTMNWEIDVFGRIAAQSKADKASYEASIADYDATLVSLCANVAKAYFQLRLAQAELAVAEKTNGMYVTVSLPYGTNPKAVIVKDAALSTDQLGKYLYVVNDSDKVVYTPVTAGPLYRDSLRVIEKGIKAGDRFRFGHLPRSQLQDRGPGGRRTDRGPGQRCREHALHELDKFRRVLLADHHIRERHRRGPSRHRRAEPHVGSHVDSS